MTKKILFLVIFMVALCNVASAVTIYELEDYSGGTTISGTSKAFKIPIEHAGKNFTLQILDSVAASGTIQGVVSTATADIADASTKWTDLDSGTISGNGFFSFYAPPGTHIRINITGSCKARILYQ